MMTSKIQEHFVCSVLFSVRVDMITVNDKNSRIIYQTLSVSLSMDGKNLYDITLAWRRDHHSCLLFLCCDGL